MYQISDDDYMKVLEAVYDLSLFYECENMDANEPIYRNRIDRKVSLLNSLYNRLYHKRLKRLLEDSKNGSK